MANRGRRRHATGILGWSRQTFPAEDSAFGWIQWKGTNVCIDIHCVCGETSHFDGEFLYWVKCPYCERVYMTNGHIELVLLSEEEKKAVEDDDRVKVADRG